MSVREADRDIESQIAAWRSWIDRRATLAVDAEELEVHLRDAIDDLAQRGLSPDEAFLIAVRRLGDIDDLSREFAREHSDRLWKHLEIPLAGSSGWRESLWFAVLAGLVAGVLLCGLWAPEAPDDARVMLLAPFVPIGALAALFLVRGRAGTGAWLAVAAGIAVPAAAVMLWPLVLPHGRAEGASDGLVLAHALVVAWLAMLVAFAGSAWRSSRVRMDAVRFSGEWAVYFGLFALGGGALLGLAILALAAVGVDAGPFAARWVVPLGIGGATSVAAWLVVAKQGVIENIVPVLAKVFTPLLTIVLLAVLGAMLLRRDFADTDQLLLLAADALLLATLALTLYAQSARAPEAAASWSDALQLVMVAAALVLDLTVLVAIAVRIGDAGLTANKVAALGLNLVLLVNLCGTAALRVRLLRGGRFDPLERWQTGYAAVFAAWAAAVVALVPPVFGYA